MSKLQVNTAVDEEKGAELLEIATLITVKALKVMYARGTAEAGEILRTHQYHDTMYEDLIQSVALAIIENGAHVWIEEKETTDEKGNKHIIKVPTFDNDASKKAIYQTVQSEVYQLKQKYYRRLYVQQATEDEDGNTEIEIKLYTKSVEEHERQINDLEAWDTIRELDTMLTDKQRDVLHMYLQGYTQKEIAQTLDIKPSTVADRQVLIAKKAREICDVNDIIPLMSTAYDRRK